MISVIMPIYNKGEYLEASLNSLFAQNMPAEFILINDNSTDIDPEAILELASKDSRARVFNMTNHNGMAYSRDFGIKHSSGDRIILHDADEIIPSNYLACMSEGLDKSRLVHPNTIYQYGLEHKIRRYNNNTDYPKLPARGFFRKDYDKVGGFNLSLGVYELGSFRFKMREIGLGSHIEIVPSYVIDLGTNTLRQMFYRSYTFYKWRGVLNHYWGGSSIKYHTKSILLPLGLVTISPINFIKTIGAILGYLRRVKPK